MRTIGLVLAILAVAAASVYPTERRVADKDYLQKQKHILHLLQRVHHPNVYDELKTIGDSYNVEQHADQYKNVQVVQKFVAVYNQGMLPRGEIFSVLYRPHMEQAITLFDLFYYANDWDTLLKTACWARERVNEGQFVYALTVALLHREDTHDVALPPVYETFPELFLDAETIQQAFEARMQYVGVQNMQQEPVVIRVNTTTPWQTTNMEHHLQYFTEDIGLNAYHTYFHLMYPFWLTAKDYGMELHRYGELFYYTHQQLLARYNVERLTVGLPEVEILIFNKPIKTGYNPNMRYYNGPAVPNRPDYLEVYEEETLIKVEQVKDIEKRLRDAIDLGYVINKDGAKVSIYERNGINILGELVESVGQSYNSRYYGNLYNLLKTLVARIVDPVYKHGVAPGAVANYMTALRDPIYYQMCKRIDLIFQKYKKNLGHYTREQLNIDGVKIDNVEVDKLVTYYENFDIDLWNLFPVHQAEEAHKVHIVARKQRLTNKPFTYKVIVDSQKSANVMVHVYVAPKYDVTGNVMDINTVRKYMVEIDRFPHKIVNGRNTIVRNSHESTVVVDDQLTTVELEHKIVEAHEGRQTIRVDEVATKYGFPQNLLLPKGRKEGMTYGFYVVLSTYDKEITPVPHGYTMFGVGYNTKFTDVKPMGFPFDLPIVEEDFFTPNMFVKDVVIQHKKTETMH